MAAHIQEFLEASEMTKFSSKVPVENDKDDFKTGKRGDLDVGYR